MCKFNPKNDSRFIDPCMPKIVELIETLTNYKVVSCCCGHHKYPMTVVVSDKKGNFLEYFTKTLLPRNVKFYKKDAKGVYYIPEVQE